ncbi:MAG: SRPBCC domain-containing protein, partial [Gemmatimonadaceae bacterium]
MLDPIVKTIEVPCSQHEAFDVFVSEMGSWWPLGKFTVSAMGGSKAKTIRVDARQGGTIVEIGPDDTEHLWGTIRRYDPYGFVSMDFHFAPPGVEVTDRSLIEVQFTALSETQTRVELTQSNWDVFGEQAPMIRGGYLHAWAT